jgi:hypothetical protein
MRSVTLVALVLSACAAPRLGGGADARPTMVAYRPGDPLPALGPDAHVDLGLRAAAEELAAGATRPDARLTPGAIRVALARAGYPGDVRFIRVVSGPELPPDLLADVPRGVPVDLGWAWRDLPDGRRWWVLGWAPRRAAMDPVPRDVPLDGAITLRVDGVPSPRLLLSAPDGRVSEVSLSSGLARRVERFSVPGEHRVEVLAGDRVALLFSLFVDGGPPAAAALPGPAHPETREAAEAHVTSALAAARARAGLPALHPFADFVPHARAHASCLASAGLVAHDTDSCPGVPALARQTHYPMARHSENVAAGDTAAEAFERIEASPGHLANLLCQDCTHAAVGSNVQDGRVFATIELLAFPHGPPMPHPHQ